VHDWRKDKIS